MKNFISIMGISCLVSACGNPGGIDDEFYEKYKKMGAPKILYQCDSQVGYTAGVGIAATYNKILQDAEAECGSPGKFKVLESKQ